MGEGSEVSYSPPLPIDLAYILDVGNNVACIFSHELSLLFGFGDSRLGHEYSLIAHVAQSHKF
jgi:hypothetical protein